MSAERFVEMVAGIPRERTDEMEGKLLLDGFTSYFIEEKFDDGEPIPGDLELHVVMPAEESEKKKWRAFFSSEGLGILNEIEKEAVEWIAEWIKSLHPFEIAPGIWVNPFPDRDIEAPEKAVVLRIVPSFAFGTGHHATTTLAARLVAKYTKPGDRVLDLGCGTAILSVIALKLGAGSALALDNDGMSVRRAVETAEENGVVLKAMESDLLAEVNEADRFDLVVANIVTDILAVDPKLAAVIPPGGRLILSGIHTGGAARLEGLFSKNDFEILEKTHLENWEGWALRRK